jgi:hypothetical protein
LIRIGSSQEIGKSGKDDFESVEVWVMYECGNGEDNLKFHKLDVCTGAKREIELTGEHGLTELEGGR